MSTETNCSKHGDAARLHMRSHKDLIDTPSADTPSVMDSIIKLEPRSLRHGRVACPTSQYVSELWVAAEGIAPAREIGTTARHQAQRFQQGYLGLFSLSSSLVLTNMLFAMYFRIIVQTDLAEAIRLRLLLRNEAEVQ